MLLPITSTGQIAQALNRGDTTFVHKTIDTETPYTAKEISELPFAEVFDWYQKNELFLSVDQATNS